jgi:hypothetical protein
MMYLENGCKFDSICSLESRATNPLAARLKKVRSQEAKIRIVLHMTLQIHDSTVPQFYSSSPNCTVEKSWNSGRQLKSQWNSMEIQKKQD